MLIVRWLGAYRGRRQNMLDVLYKELTLRDREVAAQPFPRNWGIGNIPSSVGLLVSSDALTKFFPGDCWSVSRKKSSQLRSTRRAITIENGHAECFCIPIYTGLVVKTGWTRISTDEQEAIQQIAHQFSLPVYILQEHRKSQNVKLSLREISV